MKFLFVVPQSGLFIRHFGGVARELAADHHEIVLCTADPLGLAEAGTAKVSGAAVRALQGEVPKLSMEQQRMPGGLLSIAVGTVRRLLDYAIYLRPDHPSPSLGPRALSWMSWPARLFWGNRAGAWLLRRSMVTGLLRAVERAIPPAHSVVDQVRGHAPNLVAISPYVTPWQQGEYAKAARRLGIPVAALIASWDNLSTKGTFPIQPDITMVWNEPMAREAVELHQIPMHTVRIAGAPTFDFWFHTEPSMDGAEFRNIAGLPAGVPYVVYLASSSNIAADDARIARDLAVVLRGNPATSHLHVLARPYPLDPGAWDGLEVEGLTVWPRGPFTIDTDEARAAYRATLSGCVAVVGVNTTAMVEAAIADRPCISIGARPDARFGHIAHLINAGFLEEARDVPSAVERIARIAAGSDERASQRRGFVSSFIRPCGVERDASSVMAATLAAIAAGRPEQGAAMVYKP